MRAFIDCEMNKSQAEALAQWHYDSDRFLAGTYGEDEGRGTPEFKGCSVGCMGGIGLHKAYPKKFGIVEGIAHLSDFTFERLEGEAQKIFTVDLFKAIKKGSNTPMILNKLMLWILNDKELGVYKINKSPEVKNVINLYERKIKGDKVDKKEWVAAANAAPYGDAASYAAYVEVSVANANSNSLAAANAASYAPSDYYAAALRKTMLYLFENEVIEDKYINYRK